MILRPSYRMQPWMRVNLTVDWSIWLLNHGIDDENGVATCDIVIEPTVADGLQVLLGPVVSGNLTTVRVGNLIDLDEGDYWLGYRVTAIDGQRFEGDRLVIVRAVPSAED